MDGVSTQHQEDASEVGTADKGVWERGRVCPYFGNVLCGSCAGNLIIWVGDVGDLPIHWEEFGRISPQFRLHTDGTTAADGTIWEVGVSSFDGGNGRCGIIGGLYQLQMIILFSFLQAKDIHRFLLLMKTRIF